MNLFVKYHFDEQSWMIIRETLIEIFPDTNTDEIISDGKLINIDVAETLEKFGVPMEIFLPIVQMVPHFIKTKKTESENYVVKNNTTGEYLCKSKVDAMDNPDQPELYYFSKRIEEAVMYRYNHGLTAASVTQAFNLGNRIELELYDNNFS